MLIIALHKVYRRNEDILKYLTGNILLFFHLFVKGGTPLFLEKN
ncbi:hypothetical protein HMPREF1148_0353 [Selenomonas sp. FOBRC6]|nr:hypothetical protein HMPREF1148_0353 [Selenomonas sp. FOBRC6]